MRDLMLIILCFPIIEKFINKFPKQVLFITVLLLFVPVKFPLKQALLWFCLGACIVKFQKHITFFDNTSLWIFSFIYIVGAVVALILDNSIINVLFTFLGIIYWVRMSKLIFDKQKLRRIFLQLSKWTFIIYVAHELTLTSLKKICLKLLPTTPIWLLIEYIFIPIVVIIGCIAVGKVFKKIAPQVYSISTGSR